MRNRLIFPNGVRELGARWLTAATVALLLWTSFAYSQTYSNVPPSVALTNPPIGTVFSCPAIVRLKATADDVDGTVQQVEFYDVAYLPDSQSTNFLGSVTQAPYNLSLSNVFCITPERIYDLIAVATDNQGSRSTSGPVRVYFGQDPTIPRVSITAPQEGDVFSSLEVLTLRADVAVDDGSENPVYFFSDGSAIGSATSPPYVLSISNLPPGGHVLTARYTDNLLDIGISAPVRIVVKPFSLLATQPFGNGKFGFTIQGLVTGNYFQVEASSNLFNWVPLSSNLATSNSFQFVDPTPANLRSRSYRALQTIH